MLNLENDNVSNQPAVDRSADTPLVDMTSARDLDGVFNKSDCRSQSDAVDNGQLVLTNPYEHRDHHERHHHRCHSEDERNGKDGDGSSTSDQQLMDRIKVLEQEIQKLLAYLENGPSSGVTDQPQVGDHGTPPATDSQQPGTVDQPGTGAVDQPATGTVDQQPVSTGDQPGAGGGDQTGGGTTDGTGNTGTDNTGDNTGKNPAQTSPGAIDAVMAQSPNATGPIAFDAQVNNASVVGYVGPAAGAEADRSAQVEFKDMKSYVHLKTGGWVQIEDQNNSDIMGGYWKDDWKGESMNMPVQNTKDDATMSAPPVGYVDHFWLHDGGGKIDPSQVDGFFSSAEAKANVPNSGLAASIGIDWFKQDGTSDGRAGGSTVLTDQWQPLYHTTLDRQTLENDPPPGISTAAIDGTSPTTTQTPLQTRPTESTPSQASDSNGTKLINLFPTDGQWQRIIDDAPAGSLIVTESAPDVNPKYDMPFNSIDPSLKQHIDDANAAGMETLGYVGTANGTKSLATAEAEIDSWYQNADVKGIYIGNSGKADDSGYATDPASEQYYETLANYIKAKGGMAVINGSGSPNPDYANFYDVQGTVEDSAKNYDKYPEAAWQSKYSADHFSGVLGDVPLADLKKVESEMIAKNNGYIAVADTYPAQMTDEYWKEVIANLKQS